MTVTRSEQKERTRRAILDAALELCEESALVALSLRQVAKEVGIVPTAFYRHFDSIEQLGLALVEESFETLRSMMRDVRHRSDPELKDLIDGSVTVLTEHVRAHDRHFSFIARERFAGPPGVRDAIARELALFERELATDLARLPRTDTWSGDDLRVLSSMIVDLMVAAAGHILAARPGSEAESRTIATVRSQLRMIMIGALQWESSR